MVAPLEDHESLVAVRVQDSGAHLLMIDTGSPMLIIDVALKSEHGLHTIGARDILGERDRRVPR